MANYAPPGQRLYFKTKPQTTAALSLILNQALLRAKPNPSSPKPSKASALGSGTTLPF